MQGFRKEAHAFGARGVFPFPGEISEISVFTAILSRRPYQSLPGEMSQSTTTQISLQCRFDI
jgi:hypothetical protein